jgi:hypothetical protein
MYKNVLTRYTFGLILLFSSYFPANAQNITESSTISYANADLRSDHPPSTVITSVKTAEKDTAWKPVRRIWGYAFGDFYYDAHADVANRGAETNYNGVPAYRNAFQFRRIYLGYEHDITKKFTAEILLASEPNANTVVSGTTSISNSDNLADNKMAFYIKNIDLRWKNIWKGTDFVIGEMLTPAFPLLTEKIWGYRSIERTISDFHRTNAYDVGVSLQGVFDPSAKNFGYNILIGNNSAGSPASLGSAANANTGFYKAFYGDVYAKFLNQTLIFDLYADYMKTAPATAAIGGQSRNMIKGFVAYTTPKITFGLEAYTQKLTNGVTNTVTKLPEDATVEAFSIYAHGAIYKDKLGFFIRYDGYNPDNDYHITDAYTSNTNLAAYSASAKEHFYTAGLDFTPAKNVHFEPNVWLIQYKDQRDSSTTGYLPDSHVLVYRLTFYFIFGR